jgi:hypothetical protein
MSFLKTLVVAAFCFADCGEDIDLGPVAGGGGAGGDAEGPGGAGGEGTGGAPESGSIAIHMRSSTATFAHSDGLSGQTPIAHTSGVKSLQLFRDPNDDNPVTVFDFGQDSVEVDYADGADTLVFTANAGDLPMTTFTIARVVHSWVKYRIDATMHANGFDLPGEFDNFQALSDDTMFEGTLYQSGDYEYLFDAGSMTFPASGTGAPVPEYEAGGGFSVRFEDGEWAYYFPVNLPVNPELPGDIALVLSVNMHESFRWMDETGTGFTDGVFDATPTTFEPVLQFGANSFALTVE